MSEELHPPETVTTILLLRHGSTEPTENGELYNDPDVALTEKGKHQATKLAEWLKTEKADVLLSSTAHRVQSTARIIEAATGLSLVTVAELNEWSVGDWEGRTYLDIKKKDPEDYNAWCADPISNAPPNGESIVDLNERIKLRLKDVLKEHEGKKLALVTHAGVVRSILMEALGIPVVNFWRLSIPTGSITKIDFSENFATVHYVSLRPED